MGCSSSIKAQVCPMDFPSVEGASSSVNGDSGRGSSKVSSLGNSGRGSSRVSSGFEVQLAWQGDDMQKMDSFQGTPKASPGEVNLMDDADETIEFEIKTLQVQPLANSQVPCDYLKAELNELEEFNNMKVVPEPEDLQTFNTLNFEPESKEPNRKRTVAPCAPSQRRYLKTLEKSLRCFQKNPGVLEGLALSRRRLFDQRAQGEEAMILIQEAAHQEFLVD
ncbi:unnamed protein product [Polarella glacialis]|uniref:Uncharacterized protein n=1 Tax=Polarella glacialis TaxID=89957 RepID=A0A813J070_POLGL|nr:unnamed protein product [Polarella glacialis]|mmetsp:Transcript_12105/g.19135  ORF Transcript_12105/g.19135 Transcript_12105/m.19135 type:complete len:221 (+) Transcript_12105:82-744(+)